jgi:iron complex outermembrane receptor protein
LASQIPPTRPRSACADLYQQGAGSPGRSAVDAVQSALCDGDDGVRPAGPGHQELTAPSPDDPGTLFNGLWDPNQHPRARLCLQRVQILRDDQSPDRRPHRACRSDGSTPDFPADFLPDGNPQTSIARNPHYTPKSGSVGLIQNLPYDLVGSITAQYVERAPKPAELFSRGAHDATATFDIGNPNLTIETAKSVEIGLRRAPGRCVSKQRAITPLQQLHLPAADRRDVRRRLRFLRRPDAELRQAVYSQRDAIFRGGEFQSQLDIGPLYGGIWGIEDQFDIVRATFTDGTNVPRIPPVRVGGGVYWRDTTGWRASTCCMPSRRMISPRSARRRPPVIIF